MLKSSFGTETPLIILLHEVRYLRVFAALLPKAEMPLPAEYELDEDTGRGRHALPGHMTVTPTGFQGKSLHEGGPQTPSCAPTKSYMH